MEQLCLAFLALGTREYAGYLKAFLGRGSGAGSGFAPPGPPRLASGISFTDFVDPFRGFHMVGKATGRMACPRAGTRRVRCHSRRHVILLFTIIEVSFFINQILIFGRCVAPENCPSCNGEAPLGSGADEQIVTPKGLSDRNGHRRLPKRGTAGSRSR